MWVNETGVHQEADTSAPYQLQGNHDAGPHHLSADQLERKEDAGMLAEPLRHSKEQGGITQMLTPSQTSAGLRAES